jgi:hypothetical protein
MPSKQAESSRTPPEPRRRFALPAKLSASRSRTDILIAGAGLALGLTCALFPWYIFFNQEQFGPPAMKFEGTEVEALVDDAMATPLLPRGNSEVRIIGIPELNLDYAPTGSLPRVFSAPVTLLPEQPFPDDAAPFKVLHVTAGRAMIEDDSGIWVVEPGSKLPDRSQVESIERRKGKWVVVTSEKKVLAAGG